MPKRVQLRRIKGWRKPEGAVVVSRPGKWGNPFPTADMFRAWLVAPYGEDNDRLTGRRYDMLWSLPLLRGKDLACWCPLDKPCHADVLLELANK